MTVTPDDFLSIAIDHENASEQMKLRNSISRGYYASYLAVRQRVLDANLKIPRTKGGGVHLSLINFFRKGEINEDEINISKENQMVIAGLLSHSKILRSAADYDLAKIQHEADKTTVIKNTEEIFSLLNPLPH